ncbi:MAG: 30S ribosomal protein S17 [Candidatus Dojkabacteria bacterium]
MSKDNGNKTKLRRIMVGQVVKISNPSTVKVKVEKKFPHPKYGKIVKTHKSYLVSLNGFEVEVGDLVNIGETKPISKRKSWEITEVVKKAK